MPDPQTLNGSEKPLLNGSEKPRYRVTAPTDKTPSIGVYQIPRPLGGEVAIADPLNFQVGVNRGFTPWNPSQLVSRKGLSIFDAMRMDDQVKAAMALKKHAVVATGWTVTSPQEQADDWEVTEFVKSELEAMQGTLDERLLPILTCLDYGYSCTEMVFEERMEGDFAGRIGLRDLKTKKPHHIDIVTDEFGNILPNGIVQETPQGPKALPRAKFILLTYQSDFGNPYGQSDLEAAYRGWWSKDNSYTWLTMLLERFGIPPVFALYNAAAYSGAHIDNLKAIVSRIQANTSGVIPRANKDDLEMWAPELAGQISTVFIPSLDRFDRDIARAVLMPGLLGLSSDQNQGSLARARVQFDVFMLVVEFIRKVLSETAINEQLIKPLVDINYSVDEYPEWKLNPITDDARLEILDSWNKLVQGGVVTTTAEDEVHIRNQVEFPERELDEIEADREAAEEEAREIREPEPEPDDQESPEQVAEQVEGEQRRPFRSSDGCAHHYRNQSPAEKKVNFQRINRTLDGLEAQIVKQSAAILTKERDKLLRRLRRTRNLTTAFKPRIKADQIEPIMVRELNRGFRNGRKEVRTEFGQAKFQEPGVKPVDALLWLRSLSGLSVKGIDDDLNKAAQLAIIQAVDLGEGVQGAMDRIRDAFEPYVGNPNKIVDGKVVSPHRLETIARTSTTTAMNKGRLTQIRQLDEFIEMVEFSAILDSRTTEQCSFLDGKRFRTNSPNLDRFSPPLHFNCRSVLVGITPDVEPEDLPEKDEDGFPALADDTRVLKKLRDLVPKGFGGDA